MFNKLQVKLEEEYNNNMADHPGSHLTVRKRGGKLKVGKVLGEFKRGSLKSGSGRRVTGRSQSIAIALSEARKAGSKIPKK